MARDPKTGRRIPNGYGTLRVQQFLSSLSPEAREQALRFRGALSKSKNRHKGPGATIAYAREQLRFVKEYLLDFSVKRAGERCNLTYSQALTLSKEPAVKKRIEEELTLRYKQLDMQGEKVIERLWEVVNADPEEAYDEEGQLKRLHDMPPSLRRTLSEYDPSRNRIKMQPKDNARTDLAKVHRLLTENVNIQGRVTWGEMVLRSMPSDERPQGWKDMGFKIEDDEEDAQLVPPAPQLPEKNE